MRYFPEDDELEPEEELAQTERGIDEMMRHADRLRHEVKKKKMDPKDEKLVEVAWIAGEGKATEKALREKISYLERRIKVRDEELDRLSDRDAYKARAEAAEATIERMKKLRRKKS